MAARIEAFDQANGGGVRWYKDNGAYHLYLLATEAPIARLKPTGKGDEVRIAYWSHRRKWDDIDDMGGCVRPPRSGAQPHRNQQPLLDLDLTKNVQSRA